MQSADDAQRLVEQLRPHLLRRTKDDVNLGIMPMEETLIFVEITNFQKRVYRALLEQVVHRLRARRERCGVVWVGAD